MTKISKLIKKPKLYFYDGFCNLKGNVKKVKISITKFTESYNIEQFNKILIYTIFSITLITFSYYYIIGRSRYVSTSSVIVRRTRNNRSAGISISSLLGGGNQLSLEDARYLEVYVQSPQVLEDLEKEFNFSESYKKKGLDIISGLKLNSSREKKYRFFTKQIKINLNPNSGVINLKTYSFNPEDAFKINQFLIKQTEVFVNSLNQEVYKRQLNFGKEQIKLTKNKLDKEIKKLENYQSNYKMLNIEYETKSTLKMIASLESTLVELQIKLSDARRNFINPNAPEIVYLADQVNILKRQIEKEREKLVSEEGKALNKRAVEINELESNISFLKELYKTTLATSERNKIDSSQQQRFLAVLSKPLIPEEEWNYWRHKGFLTYTSLLLIIISLGKFILGIADNHRD